MDELEQITNQITGGDLLGRIIVAAVILVSIAIISHIVTRWIKHIVARDSNDLPQSTFFINIARCIIWAIGISIVADACFSVNMTAVVAALGVGGIALSLGLQDTLSNLIGGVLITFMRIVTPGDNIQVGTHKGVVQDINWRQTRIKNRLGETVIIPNSVISRNSVVHLPPPEQISVLFVVTSQTGLDEIAEEVEKHAHDTALEYAGIVTEPVVIFTEVSEYGLNGKVVLEIDDAAEATVVSDAITRAIAPAVR